MNDPFCERCAQFMVKIKSGIEVRHNNQAKQRGDRFQCPQCRFTVIADFGDMIYD